MPSRKPALSSRKKKSTRRSSNIKTKDKRNISSSAMMQPKVKQPELEQTTTSPADVVPVATSIWSPIRNVEEMTAADWFRLFNAAVETVRLPDGSFQSSWYREAISRAVHAGKTGITIQDVEAARTYENVMDIKLLMMQASNRMLEAESNWWRARHR